MSPRARVTGAEGSIGSLERDLRAAEAEIAVLRAAVEQLERRLAAEQRRSAQWRDLVEGSAESHKWEGARPAQRDG